MAQLGEDEHLSWDYGNSIIGTYFSAFPTIGASCLIHSGNRDRYRLALAQRKMEEYMGVGFFYIAV
jgi:hypothetical protein